LLHAGISLGLVLEGQPRARGVVAVGLVWLVLGWASPATRLPRLPPADLTAAPIMPTSAHQVLGGVVFEGTLLYCGDAELPCAGKVEPVLRFRVPGVVANGFAVRGVDGSLPAGFAPRWRIDRGFLLSSQQP
jgi:hypothetical protein